MVKNLLKTEKKLVFYINFLLIILVILTFLFKIHLQYFFYANILITFIVSYIFFRSNKKLSKDLIATNLFIFFIFLFPFLEEFLYYLFGSTSYYIRIFYDIFITYLFLLFTGNRDKVFRLSKPNTYSVSITILASIFLGGIFYLLKEPIPPALLETGGATLPALASFFFNALGTAIFEELMIIGVFYLTYKRLGGKKDAIIQSSLIFLLFHLLRLNNIIINYFKNFHEIFMIYLVGYYLMLFIFMIASILSFDTTGKRFKGNFLYPLLLHTLTDFSLLSLYFFF